MPCKCACGVRGKRVQLKGMFTKACAEARNKPCDPLGRRKAGNAKSHAKSNAVTKIKKRANEEAALVASGAGKDLMGNQERDTLVESLSTDTHLLIKCQHDGDHPDERLRGYSLDQLMAKPEFSCYVGYTGQQLMNDESLRWLTERGSNCPVLAWAQAKSNGNGRTHIING